MTSPASSPPTRFAVALFDGFQSLDVFGPLDVLNFLSKSTALELSLLGPTLHAVSTLHRPGSGRIGERVVPTHTYATAPEDIEVLLVPGGQGTRDADNTQVVVDFVRERFPRLRYLLTVCTGSALAARAGVLDGREATTNKLSFDWVASHGNNVKWLRKARWATDENVWTSSGISAGIDMMYAFIADQYGEDVAASIAHASEYVRNKDPSNDPFAKPEPAQ